MLTISKKYIEWNLFIVTSQKARRGPIATGSKWNAFKLSKNNRSLVKWVDGVDGGGDKWWMRREYERCGCSREVQRWEHEMRRKVGKSERTCDDQCQWGLRSTQPILDALFSSIGVNWRYRQASIRPPKHTRPFNDNLFKWINYGFVAHRVLIYVWVKWLIRLQINATVYFVISQLGTLCLFVVFFLLHVRVGELGELELILEGQEQVEPKLCMLKSGR